MKISFSVKNDHTCRSSFQEIILPGYYGTEDVINDLAKVLEYHSLRHEKYKKEHIAKWGQKHWDEYMETRK